MDGKRVQKSGDQLAVGDWLAPDALMEGAFEVLFAYAYPASADRSRDNDGTHVQLVVREQGKAEPWVEIVAGNHLFDLASEADLAPLREQAERAQFTAGLREFADWLDANPWAPFKRLSGYTGAARIQIDLHGGDMDATAETVAQVREYAERMGVKVDESLDDRTDASIKIGSVEYSVIAWHRDGRPAEPAPEPLTPAPIAEHYDASAFNTENVCACGDAFGSRRDLNAHILGLAYSRADDEPDDPTPVSGARVAPHVGAVTDEGLVDETPDTKPLPNCLPGCRRTDAEYGPGSSSHADNCPELNCPECGRRHVPWCAS